MLFTLTILIQSGLNIRGLNYYEQRQQEFDVMSEDISNRILDVDEPAAIIPFIGMILTLTVVSYGILYLYAMIKFS